MTLLTGHTLYNDSTVVIRELAQNAIDAVRLQWKGQNPEKNGRVKIKWNSATGELSVSDNGTGMTQDTVERHLLKVGSSKYQDERFRKSNPDFNPISRFGIGVLTAFMVANSVEILTVSPEEAEARQISLRSVHGKYLIRLLDPVTDPALTEIRPHGTTLKLVLRSSAKRSDVLATVKRWIVFPRCRVTVEIDDQEPVDVGYETPEDALSKYLASAEGKTAVRNKEYRIISNRIGPLDLAYVVGKNGFYNDWSLISISDLQQRFDLAESPIGICIEGIAVDFNSPGFNARNILAIANATGKDAPRTNVARSALEDTEQRSQSIALLYNEYFRQVSAEIERLAEEPEYSLSWAIGQATYIAAPLTSLKPHRLSAEAYDDALSRAPLFLLETENARISISLAELKKRDSLWIIDSPLVRSVESLVKEAPTNITARSIIDLTHGENWLPAGDMISGATYSTLATETIDAAFDVVEINIKEGERRIDLRLTAKTSERKWISESDIIRKMQLSDARTSYPVIDYFRDRARQRRLNSGLNYPVNVVPTNGLEDFGGVQALGVDYILSSQGIAGLVSELYPSDDQEDLFICVMCCHMWASLRSREDVPASLIGASADKLITQVEDDLGVSGVNWIKLKEAVDKTQFRYFDPFAWSRRDGAGSFLGAFS